MLFKAFFVIKFCPLYVHVCHDLLVDLLEMNLGLWTSGNLCHSYGAENWILGEACLELLESFKPKSVLGSLKSKFHSQLSVRIGLSWPSISSRI